MPQEDQHFLCHSRGAIFVPTFGFSSFLLLIDELARKMLAPSMKCATLGVFHLILGADVNR
jgi:hypothetical protein